MSKTIPSALAILAAGAALAFWFLERGDARGAGGEEAARPGAPARAIERDVAPDLAPAAAAAPMDLGIAPAHETGRVAATAAAPAPSETGFWIRLVHGDDGSPVPHAEVFAFAGEVPAGEPARTDPALLDGWIARTGVSLRADAEGIVRVPSVPTAATLVVARTDDLWGRAYVRAAPEAPKANLASDEPKANELPTVKLSVDRTLLALVVDERGAPLEEVEVHLLRSHPGGGASGMATARTGAGGIARFAHVQQNRRPDVDGERWIVRVDALFADMLARDLDPDDLPREPVRFTLRGTGAVVVRLFDALGEPWLAESQVSLAAIPAGEARELSPFGSNTRPTLHARAQDGVARFPRVGGGLELAAEARRQDSPLTTTAYGPGPRAAGETAEIRVAFGSRHPVVMMRVIGLDGAPLVDTTVFVGLTLKGRMRINGSPVPLVSDARGRIRIDVAADLAQDDVRTARVFTGTPSSPEAAAVVDLSRDFEPGLHDLGDVVLRPPALFVRGRVVDELGLGVANAELVLERARDGGRAWEEVWELGATSAGDGSFEVRTEHAGEAFRLRARKDGYTSQPVEFRPGADVVVRLSVAGSISGSLLVDPEIPLEEIRVFATRQEPEPSVSGSSWRPTESVRANGIFVLGSLEAGAYTVHLRLKKCETALFEVADVQVAPGRDTADPRLQLIDLRGKLHAFRLTLVRPDGKQELQGNYSHGPAGAEELDRRGWFRGPEVVIVSTADAIDVDLAPRGFMPEELRGVRGDETVELSTGMTVLLRLRDTELPAPPYFLHPALSPAGVDGWNVDWSTPAFGEDREVRVQGVQPGRARVGWFVQRRSGSTTMATLMPSHAEIVIDVLPGVADQAFDVTLPARKLETFLAELGW